MRQKFPKDPCLVCGFLHPLAWECPEMGIEIRLRLALDKLRTTPSKNPDELAVKRAFLTQKLVRLQEKEQAAAQQTNGS
jgi:hypothetical protein